MYLQCWKSTRRRDKLIILWTLFSIQIFLIGLFVLFGSLNIAAFNPNFIEDEALIAKTEKFGAFDGRLVKFLTTSLRRNISRDKSSYVNTSKPLVLQEPSGRFEREFFLCQNASISNVEHITSQNDLFCFRNGSVATNFNDLNSVDEEMNCVCKCKAHYHGKDCGQPEVVWRAFMTSHIARAGQAALPIRTKPQSADDVKPNRIFYFVNSSIFSLTTVEIQFMELHDVIDLLILCDEIRNRTETNHINAKYSKFSYHQTSHGHHSPFFLKQFSQKILILQTIKKCTPNNMLKLFRKRIEITNESMRNTSINWTNLNNNDVLIFSSYDEILNRQAISYLKWYKDWTEFQPIKFRLKHNVYGFYWQHPSQTILSSAVCQLGILDERYHGEPERMLQSNDAGMIIGDLNHYGGWFCQYCYESTIDIVHKLQSDNQLFSNEANLDANLNKLIKSQPNVIDSTYIESLISAGVFIDGKLNLLRLHRYSDKYYAPKYVVNKTWKYESILSNTYAHYDGEDEE